METEMLSEAKAQELYKLLYNLRTSRNVKVGYNEAVKSVGRSTALLAVVAGDAQPYAIVEPLPVLCGQKGVDVVYVPSKSALGKACRLQVDVVACAVCVDRGEDSSRVQSQINSVLK